MKRLSDIQKEKLMTAFAGVDWVYIPIYRDPFWGLAIITGKRRSPIRIPQAWAFSGSVEEMEEYSKKLNEERSMSEDETAAIIAMSISSLLPDQQ